MYSTFTYVKLILLKWCKKCSYCKCFSTACVHRKSGEIAKLLLDSGADPNLRGADGLTPVHKAITSRDLRTLKVLVNHPKTDICAEVSMHAVYIDH